MMNRGWPVVLCALIVIGSVIAFPAVGQAPEDDFIIIDADATARFATSSYTGPLVVEDRYIFQYLDGSKVYSFTSVPLELDPLLPDRYIFQYLDGSKVYSFTSVPPELRPLILDRFIFQYLDWNIFSTALVYPVDLIEDDIEPVISGISYFFIDTDTVRITWLTDEYANSEIWYGSSPGSLTNHIMNLDWDKSHAIDLLGISQNTTYYYRISSTDRSGNSAQSDELSFTIDRVRQFLPFITK